LQRGRSEVDLDIVIFNNMNRLVVELYPFSLAFH